MFHLAVFHEHVHGAQGGGDHHAHGHFFMGVVEVALAAAGLEVGAEVGGEGGAHAFGVADHGDEGAGPVGVAAGFVHEGAYGNAEAFGAASHGFADGEDLFGELDGEFQADGFEHLFAGAEVVVDGAVGGAGFVGEGVEGQVADAGAGVDAQGGVPPLLPAAWPTDTPTCGTESHSGRHRGTRTRLIQKPFRCIHVLMQHTNH